VRDLPRWGRLVGRGRGGARWRRPVGRCTSMSSGAPGARAPVATVPPCCVIRAANQHQSQPRPIGPLPRLITRPGGPITRTVPCAPLNRTETSRVPPDTLPAEGIVQHPVYRLQQANPVAPDRHRPQGRLQFQLLSSQGQFRPYQVDRLPNQLFEVDTLDLQFHLFLAPDRRRRTDRPSSRPGSASAGPQPAPPTALAGRAPASGGSRPRR
jgi:hypothetical protein